jgi:pimeloyl-ACP methyl ester carboxylesterase
MKPFTLLLSNGARVSGLVSIPTRTSTTPHHRPLLVGVHGGTYTSSYFAAGDGANSSLTTAAALGVPFVAIDRPGYKDSTPLPSPVAEGSTFLQDEGKWLHEHTLPAIWNQWGVESEATTIVVLAHSLGSPSAIVAAALHARSREPAYPLGGLIVSGWGTEPAGSKEVILHMIKTMSINGRISFPIEHKDEPMLGGTLEERQACASPEILSLTTQLDHSMSHGEAEDGNMFWFGYWLDYARDVSVPIMYAMGEHDGLWKATTQTVEDFARCFKGSRRVERGVVLEAPHCLELSFWGPGWIARCAGFAVECAAATATIAVKQSSV